VRKNRTKEIVVKRFVGRCYHCHHWSGTRKWWKNRLGKCRKTGQDRRVTQHCNCGQYAGAYGNLPHTKGKNSE